MKCFFCGADGQAAHEECSKCGRVVNLRNFDTPIIPRIRKPGSSKKFSNTTVFFGFLAVVAVIVTGTVMKPSGLSGFFAIGNPHYSSRELARIKEATDDPYYFGVTAGKRERENAVAFFQTSSKGPRAAEAFYHLGLFCLKAQDHTGARKLFEQSLEANSDFVNPKFYLQGISTDNLFDMQFISDPSPGTIRVFKRLWEIHRLYTRVWIFVVTGDENEQEIFNLSSPPLSAPNRIDDVLGYGRIGRIDVRSADEKTKTPEYGNFIKRTFMIQVRVPLRKSEGFVITFQAPYFIGVNPAGQIDVNAFAIPGAEMVTESFAFPKGSEIEPETNPDKVSAPQGWEIFGYTVTGPYRQIRLKARTSGRTVDLDGLGSLGYGKGYK